MKIITNSVMLLIPQNWNSKTAIIILVCLEVKLTNILSIVYSIGNGTWSLFAGGKFPKFTP